MSSEGLKLKESYTKEGSKDEIKVLLKDILLGIEWVMMVKSRMYNVDIFG